MIRKRLKLLVVLVPILIAVFAIERSARGPGPEATGLASIAISASPNALMPVTPCQLTLGVPTTVYAVGLDERGNLIPLPGGAAVDWAGGDGLEVTSLGPHSATVLLANPLLAEAADLSAGITHNGRGFNANLHSAQPPRAMPKNFSLALLKDPTSSRTIDVERMRVGQSITVFLRAMSLDMATAGEIFPLPPHVEVEWESMPSPPLAVKTRITPLGPHAARIELVREGEMEGLPISVRAEVRFRNGAKQYAAFVIELTD